MTQPTIQLCVNPKLKYIVVADASRLIRKALAHENPTAPTLDVLVVDAMNAVFDHMNPRWAQYTGVAVRLNNMIYKEIMDSSLIEPAVKMFFAFHKTIAKRAINCIVDSFIAEVRKTF